MPAPNWRIVPGDPEKLPLCTPPPSSVRVPVWTATVAELLKAMFTSVVPAPADFLNIPGALLLNATPAPPPVIAASL